MTSVPCLSPFRMMKAMDGLTILCPGCGEPGLAGKRFCAECGLRLPAGCLACGAQSAGGMRFCGECGAAMPGFCPTCGVETFGARSFCPRCGSALSAPAPPYLAAPHIALPVATGQERRLVTALFCDLVGFTPLSERLDAEEVRELQTAYFAAMSAEIERHGGIVEKFAGDAVLALFGARQAHEDDAEQAVRCALTMHSALELLVAGATHRWGEGIALRAGVNTGEGVSGTLEIEQARGSVTVTGDVVNTAARLQAAASPGGVLVGALTMRLAERTIEFGPRQDLQLKGKTEPVVAYAARGIRELPMERWDAGGERHPFVGRQREMETLLALCENARTGSGQLVMLVAEAGAGKSRLLAEALQRITGSGDFRALHGRCLSHGQDSTFFLLAGLLRDTFGIRQGDEPQTAADHLAGEIEDLLVQSDEEGRATAVDVLGEVLGLPVAHSSVTGSGAQTRRLALIKTMRQVLAALAAQHPTVVILEDLHWIDAASAEVLAEVLVDLPGLPMLVLAAQRPGWSPPWGEWGFVERVNLHPLPPVHALALAGAVLGGLRLSPALEEYVVERSAGNPFYIEELLAALEDAGALLWRRDVVDLTPGGAELLPVTLTEIVLSRFDRLEPEVRNLIQVASVIGRNFAVDLLEQLASLRTPTLDRLLDALRRNEIAFPEPEDQLRYAFRHVTLRDVAYNTILLRRRQQLHAAVAASIQRLYESEKYVEVIAYHYARTEAHAEAALWLERAGDRAAQMYANQAAIAQYEAARKRLRLCEAGDAQARVTEKLGAMFHTIAWYDEALEELQAAAAAYREMHDAVGEARTAARIGRVHFLRGAREEAIASVQEVLLRLSPGAHSLPSAALADLYLALVEPLYHGHQFAEALQAAERAAALTAADDAGPVRGHVELQRCLALAGAGRLPDAQEAGERALAIAQRAGDRETLVGALSQLGDITLARGSAAVSRSYYERALSAGAERGDPAEMAHVLGRLGNALFIAGLWADALSHLERAVDLVRSISFAYFSASTLLALGEQYLLIGEAEAASRYLDEPFTIATRSGYSEAVPYLHIPLAAAEVRSGEYDAALGRLQPLLERRAFNTDTDHRAMQVAANALLYGSDGTAAHELIDEGERLARRQDNRLALLTWLSLRALAAMIVGDSEAASADVREALDLAIAIPYPYGEAHIRRQLAQLSLATGQPEDAQKQLSTAAAIFARLGARPDLERIEGEIMASVANA